MIDRACIVSCVVWLAVLSACATQPAQSGWRERVAQDLCVMGHRNWIVIADSAYPWQSAPGITMLVSDAGHLETVRAVLEQIEQAPHVQPVVYTDAELTAVSEADAPGIDGLRRALREVLAGRDARALPHMEVIERLDEAAALFRVLVVKTDLALPYTSVFIELDCGYWGPDCEQRLRRALENVSRG